MNPLRLAREILATLRRRVLEIAIFVVAAALPPASVWLLTHGHGAVVHDNSDSLRVPPAHDDLDAKSWADYGNRIVRLPIDAAIDRYVRQH